MQFEPGSSDTADALKTALEDSTRRISMLLEFDWNRDGQYAHSYSNLSDIATSVTVDRQATSNVPEEVQTFTAYSSAELTVTLHGRRDASEDYVHQQFSPWWQDSLVYGKNVPGTPIRYSRVVHTALGDIPIRQFTGWVRSFQINRDDSDVEIVASDALDVMNAPVTLPSWGRHSPLRSQMWEGANPTLGPRSAAYRPIELGWVVEEAFRQGGTPTGPLPHPLASAYWTCNGSFLPSIGTVTDGYNAPLGFHLLGWNTAPAFQNGIYGLEPVPTEPAYQRGEYYVNGEGSSGNGAVASLTKNVNTWSDGGTSNNTWGMSAWVRVTKATLGNQFNNGSGGFTPMLPTGGYSRDYNPTGHRVFTLRYYFWSPLGLTTSFGYSAPKDVLSSFWNRAGGVQDRGDRALRYLEMNVFDDGTVGLVVRDTPSGLGNTDLTRGIWWAKTLPGVGHHFYDVRFQQLTNGAITPQLRIDGSTVALTVQQSPSGWTSFGDDVREIALPGFNSVTQEFRMQLAAFMTEIPVSHVQVYAGTTSDVTAADANWDATGHAPTREGRPLAVMPHGSFADCTYVPETKNVPAWDLLRELSEAEMAILHTDEFATKYFLSNAQARLNREEAIARVDELGLRIADERLLSFVVHPTEDLYRNAVSVAYEEKSARWKVLWSLEDWLNWKLKANTNEVLDIPVSGAISLMSGAALNLGGEYANPDIDGGWFRPVFQRDYDLPDSALWNAFRAVNPADSAGDIGLTDPANEGWGYLISGMQMRIGPSLDGFYLRRFMGPNAPYRKSASGTTLYATEMQFTAKPNLPNSGTSDVAGSDTSYAVSWHPNFWVTGMTNESDDASEIIVRNEAEVSAKGERMVKLNSNQWRSWKGGPNNGDGAYGIAESLLEDLTTPAPVIDQIDVPADPRLQLLDVISLESEGGITGRIFAQVEGLTRTDTKDSFTDTVTARIVETPGGWLLGTSGVSELGSTTILG